MAIKAATLFIIYATNKFSKSNNAEVNFTLELLNIFVIETVFTYISKQLF